MNRRNLNAEELYIVHNNIMAKAHQTLMESGLQILADRLQQIATDRDGAFILHTVIQEALELAYLDQETEPTK